MKTCPNILVTSKYNKDTTIEYFPAENTITGKVSRDGILPELPCYRLPGRFSVRPALRTQGEKGNATVLSCILH